MGVWISYDLIGINETSADYEKLIAKIKSLGPAKKVEYSLWGQRDIADARGGARRAEVKHGRRRKLIVMPRTASAWRNLGADITTWLKRASGVIAMTC